MTEIDEGSLRFHFPDNVSASKFDDWSFYRNQFMKLAGAEIGCSKCEETLQCSVCGAKKVAGTKGIDLLAIQAGQTCWQIEIKDYRQTRVGNFQFLADEVALKVRDTLAALVVARLNGNDPSEREAAIQALACKKIRVVLHLEQPTLRYGAPSKDTRRINVKDRLKSLVNSIDPRPLVVDLEKPGEVAWNVTQVGAPPR